MTYPSSRWASSLLIALGLSALLAGGCTGPKTTANPPVAAAKTVAGRWQAEFTTQIGVQKYTFDFKLSGNILSGTAVGQIVDQPAREPVTLTECTLTGNAIHFVESRDNNGTPLRIEYTGTVTGDTMPLKRAVGDFGTTEAVAKRVVGGA